MDPSVMKEVVKKIPPNPATGRVDMNDIMKYMMSHPEDMERMTTMIQKAEEATPAVNLESFDYAGLKKTIIHETFWVVQLDHIGTVDAQGKSIDPGKEATTPGARQMWEIYIYDEKSTFRAMHECKGLPTESDLLNAIQTAIASPIYPLKPALPWLLLVATRLAPHLGLSRDFLNSLPAPFHWRVETAEEAEKVASGVHRMNESGVARGLRLGADAKTAGNTAFAKKDRVRALKSYSIAIDHFIDALSQRPDVEDEKKAKTQLAICYANRAATHLLPGEGADPKAALEDGQRSEQTDPSYEKAYYRQAIAHEQLNDKSSAIDMLSGALQRPDLENSNALVDKFIELITDGKGFPKDEAAFKSWSVDAMLNNRVLSNQISPVKGEFKRRMDASFKGESTS